MVQIFELDKLYFADQVIALCDFRRVEKKIWLTNDHLTAQNLLHNLAIRGYSWINLITLSPRELSKMIFLQQKGLTEFLSHDQQIFIIKSILDDLQKRKVLKIFQSCNHSLSFAQYFVEWFSLMESQGRHLTNGCLSSKEIYGNDLKQLFFEYKKFLKEKNLFDINHCYQFLNESCLTDSLDYYSDFCDVIFYDKEEVFDDYFNQYFCQLSKESLQRDRLKCEDLFWTKERFFSISYNPWCEIEEVIGFLIKKDVRWDCVEILVPDTDTYFPLLKRICAEKGIPVTYEMGTSLFETYAGRLLKKIIQFFQEDCDQDIFIQFFRDHLIAIPRDLSSQNLSECLDSLNVGWSVFQWKNYVKKNQNEGTKESSFICEFVNDLLSLVELYRSQTVSVENVLSILHLFLKKYVIQNSLEKKEILLIFLETLKQMSLPHISFSQGDMIFKIIVSLLKKKLFQQSLSKEGHLHVRSLFTPFYRDRKWVILLGFNDIWIPGKVNVNPLVDDSLLPIVSDVDECKKRREEITHLIQHHSGSLYLSCVKIVPMKTNYDILPSSLMLCAYRDWTKDINASYEMMSEALYTHSSYREVFLSGICLFEEGENQRVLFEKRKNSFACRQQSSPTLYDAFFSGDEEIFLEIKQLFHKTDFSASSLERMAKCPFLYYVKDILCLKKPLSYKRNEKKWLSAPLFGSLIHRSFFRIMTFVREKTLRGEDFSQEECFSVAEKIFEDYQKKHLYVNKGLFIQQSLDFKNIIEAFVQYEFLRKERKVTFLEWNFGRDAEEEMEGCQRGRFCYELPDERMIEITGSIDRIDRAEDGSMVLLDYKTGLEPLFLKHSDQFLQGRRLQAYLYGDIFEKITGKKVSSSGYFYATPKGHFCENLVSLTDRNALKQTIALIVEAIDLGHFMIMKGLDSQTGICSSCDGQSSCWMYGKDAIDQKVFHKKIQTKQPLLELQGIK